MLNRYIKSWLALLLLSLASASARAVALDGTPVLGCLLSDKTYSCVTSPAGKGDVVTIAAGYILTVSNGSMSVSSVVIGAGSGINASVTSSGAVAMGANSFIHGNVTSTGSSVTMDAAAYVTGNLSAGTTLTVAAGGYISGNAQTGTTVVLADSAYIGGTLTAGDTITIAANGYVKSDLTAATTVTLAAGAYTNGNLIAGTTATLAAGAFVLGNFSAGTTATLAADAYVGGDLTAGTTATFGAASHVGGNLTANIATAAVNAIFYRNLTADTATLADGVCVYGVITAKTLTVAAGSGKCAGSPGPDHLLIRHNGSALTCAPQTVSVSACADAACSSLYTGGVALTMMPGGLPFLIDSSGINNAATVQQTSVGVASLSAVSTPGAASTCFNTTTNSASCAMTVAAAGFLLQIPNHVADTMQSFTVSAVKQADNSQACVPAFANVNKTLNFQCSYNNPASGTLPVRMGAQVPLADSSTASCSAAGASLSLNFNALGLAPATLAYADVGRMTLSATLVPLIPADSGLTMTGSASFISAPASFGFSQIRQSTAAQLDNPVPADPNSASFIQSGAPFSSLVTALNASNLVTPNFGSEMTPETATLSSVLVAPVGGANPALQGALGAFSQGAASAGALAWNDVGIIALKATLANPYGYLGSAAVPTGLISSGASVNVGRFIPAYFNTVINSAVPMACPAGLTCALPLNAFVYSAQPFGVTVTAFSLSGGITTNYSTVSGFAKTVTVSAWSDRIAGASQNPSGTLAGGALSSSTLPTFMQGAGSNPALAYHFASGAVFPAKINLAPPTNIYLRAADTDGVTSLLGSTAAQAGITVTGARLLVGHTYGSELLPVSISVIAQYWDGLRYQPSVNDNGSSFSAADVLISNCWRNKAATPCAGLISTAAIAASTNLVNGSGRFKLGAIGPGNSASIDVSLGLPLYLPATTGRIVYGLFKSPLVFIREMY